MTLDPAQGSQDDTLTVTLRYLANTDGLSEVVPSVGGQAAPDHNANYVDQTVKIHDARRASEPFDIDRNGFSLEQQETEVSDFYDDAQISSIYDAEIRALVTRQTGATRIEIFDHTRRSASNAVRVERQIREPASTIHSDYSALSGIQRLLDHFHDRADEVVTLMKNRFAIVNVWRSIAGTIETFPLTMCDTRTVRPDNLVAVKRKGRDRLGEVQMALHDDAHTWYYYPDMKMNEVLVFKTYDSSTDGRARFTIHSAFDDPNSAPNARPRESIETRCFAFFE